MNPPNALPAASKKGYLTLLAAVLLAFILALLPQLTADVYAAVGIAALSCDTTAVPGDSTYTCTMEIVNTLPTLQDGSFWIKSDIGPAEASIVSLSGSADWSISGSSSLISYGVPAGTETLTLEFHIPPDAHYVAEGAGNRCVQYLFKYASGGSDDFAQCTVGAISFTPTATVSYEKVLLNDGVAPGGVALWEISLHNDGPSDIHNLALTDTTAGAVGAAVLPPQATTGFDLLAHTGRTFIVSAPVNPGASPGDAFSNTVALNVTGVETGIAASFPITPVPPRLAIAAGQVGAALPAAGVRVNSIVLDSPTIVPGNTLTIDVEVENLGTAAAQDPTLILELDSIDYTLLNFSSIPAGSWLSSSGLSVERSQPMPIGVETLRFELQIDSDAHYDVSSASNSIRAMINADNPDSNIRDNVRAIAPQVRAQANLNIEKQLLNNRVAPGGRALYEVTVCNSGPSDLFPIFIRDVPGLNLGSDSLVVSSDADAGNPLATGLYVAAGTCEDVMVSARVLGGALEGDLFFNEARIVVDGTDAAGAGATRPAVITFTNRASEARGGVGDPLPEAQLRVRKQCQPVVPGDAGGFQCRIRVENLGPGSAHGLTLSDHFDDIETTILDSPQFFAGDIRDARLAPSDANLWNCGSANGMTCVRREPLNAGRANEIVVTFGAPPDAHLMGNGRPENNVFVAALNSDPFYPDNSWEIALDVEPAAQLGIVKAPLQASVAPNSTALFEISVRNEGPSDIAGIFLDDICSGASAGPDPVYVSPAADHGFHGLYVPGHGNSTDAAGTVTVLASCAVYDAAPSGDYVINNAEILTNRAIAGSSTLQTRSGYNLSFASSGPEARARVEVGDYLPAVDLRVEKELIGPQLVTSGDTLDWRLTVIHMGGGKAENVILRDRGEQLLFPPRLENYRIKIFPIPALDANGQPRTCLAGSDGVQCQLGAMLPGDEVSVTVSAGVSRAPEACSDSLRDPGNNLAFVSADNPESYVRNNGDILNPFWVACEVNLDVQKSVLKDELCMQSYGLYEIEVTNEGPTDAENVQIRDLLPEGLIYGGGSPACFAGGQQNGRDLALCGIGDLAVGESVDVLLGFNMDHSVISAGQRVGPNQAQARSRTSYAGDTEWFSYQGAEFTAVFCDLPPADLDATTAIAPLNTPVAGEVYEFELYVENNGPNPAQGVIAHHQFGGLPGDWQIVGEPSAGQNWQCDTHGLSCSRVGTMPVGREHVATYELLLPPDASTAGAFGAPGDKEIVQELTVSADNPDPDLQNNRHAIYQVLHTLSNLVIRKEALVNEIIAGGSAVPFKIFVTNNGPSDAYDVTIFDDPGQLIMVSMSSSNVLMRCGPGVCYIPVLPAGEQAIVDVLVRAEAHLTPGDYVNTAQIQSCRSDDNNTCILPEQSVVEAPVKVAGWADLKLQKFVKPDGEIFAGEPFLFTIMVDNLGISMAQGIQVEDTLFSSGPFKLVRLAPSGAGSCDVSLPQSGNTGQPITFKCSLDELPRFGRWVINATVVADEAVDVNNEARVFARGLQDPDMGNNSDTASMHVKGSADVSVEKTARTPSVVAGETASWTVKVRNNGPSTAKNVQVFDILPAAITAETIEILPATAACTVGTPGDPSDPTVCSLGDLALNEEVTLTVRGRVDPNYSATPGIFNDVRVQSDTYDPNGGNNRDSAALGVTGTGDLTIFKQSLPANATAGNPVTYLIEVSSGPPSKATKVMVEDNLPQAFIFESILLFGGSGSECSYARGPHRITCVLGDMSPGESHLIQVEGMVAPDTQLPQISNTATVTSSSAPEASSTAVTNITTEAYLSATKHTSTSSPATGDVFSYIVEVTNHGPSLSRNVHVYDELTGSVQYLYSRGVMCSNSGVDVYCDLGDIPAGDTVKFEIVVQVKEWVKEGHRSDNVIEVTAATSPHDTEPVLAYSEDIVFRNVNDLKIRKFGKPDDNVSEGQKLVYTIVVDNFGPGTAYNTKVIDLIASDGSYSFIAPGFCSPHSGSANGNKTLVCDIGRLDPGDQEVFNVAVTAKAAQSLNNQADVESDGTDRDNSNNHAIVEHEIVDVADLGVEVTQPVALVLSGEELVYTVVVTNHGPSKAANVEFKALLTGSAVVKSIQSTKGNCLLGGLSCALGNLAVDQEVTITIKATVYESVSSGNMIIMDTLVSAETYDNDNSNDWASVISEVTAVRRLRLQMNSSTQALRPGDVFTLHVRAFNDGQGMIDDVRASVALSPLLTYLSDTAACGADLTGCRLGNLVPEQEVRWDILVQLTDDPQSATAVTSSASAKSNNVYVEVDTTDAVSSLPIGGGGAQIILLPMITSN